jgi:hypothetical protein
VKLGREDGIPLGNSDGEPLGAEVGSSIGGRIGAELGCPVASGVGCLVRPNVGNPVGTDDWRDAVWDCCLNVRRCCTTALNMREGETYLTS